MPYSQTEARYRVVVKSDPCEVNTFEYFRLQYELLHNVANDQMLGLCGPVAFQRMNMKHDGVQWVAEFEAIVAEKRS